MILLITSHFPKYPNQAQTNDSDPWAELSALSNAILLFTSKNAQDLYSIDLHG